MKDELQKRVVRKLDPDLHVKTHFKAATSILMQDTKSMNLENGQAKEIMKLAVNAKNEDVMREEESLHRHISHHYDFQRANAGFRS